MGYNGYYYNQNDYAAVPYPRPSDPEATVKSGGCGPTCMAMLVANLAVKAVNIKDMAAYAIKKGAREDTGTDMGILSKAIAADYGFTLTTTNDETALLKHLKADGLAIANVGGDRKGYTGVFSDAGHYVVVADVRSDGRISVLDPGYYVGKFSKPGRSGKVGIDGHELLCAMSVLAEDTSNRNPAYYLFSRKEVKPMADAPSINVVTIKVGTKTVKGVEIAGNTLAPVRAIAEALGKTVAYDDATKTVLIK